MNVTDMKKVEANRSLSFKTVTGYIVFDDCAVATKLTKYGPEKMKEDIILTDNKDQIFLNIWENTLLTSHAPSCICQGSPHLINLYHYLHHLALTLVK